MMLKYLFLPILLLIVGCQSDGPCSFNLIAGGWEPTDIRPDALPVEEHRNSGWYLNEEGSILICPNQQAAGDCGNIYLVFKKTERGYVEDQEIVCIT